MGFLSTSYSSGLDGAACMVGSMMMLTTMFFAMGLAVADTQEDLVLAADDTLGEDVRMDAFLSL